MFRIRTRYPNFGFRSLARTVVSIRIQSVYFLIFLPTMDLVRNCCNSIKVISLFSEISMLANQLANIVTDFIIAFALFMLNFKANNRKTNISQRSTDNRPPIRMDSNFEPDHSLSRLGKLLEIHSVQFFHYHQYQYISLKSIMFSTYTCSLQMPIRNVLISNLIEIAISYLEIVRETDVSDWHLTVYLSHRRHSLFLIRRHHRQHFYEYIF